MPAIYLVLVVLMVITLHFASGSRSNWAKQLPMTCAQSFSKS